MNDYIPTTYIVKDPSESKHSFFYQWEKKVGIIKFKKSKRFYCLL